NRHQQARQAKLDAEKVFDENVRRSEFAREKRDQAQRRLDSLPAGADGSVQDLESDLQKRAMQWQAAQGQIDKTNQLLDAFSADPNEQRAQARQNLAGLREILQQNRDQQVQCRTKLDTLAERAPYSALSEIDEQIHDLDEAIAVERLRNDAIRLLHETLRACRREAVEAVFEPVQNRTTDLLRRIAGTRLGAIRFSESLLPDHVVPEGVDEPRGLSQTSGGEQEQVHLAVRLALAEVLLGDARQPMVLDDVLTATDPERLSRILGLLDEAADKYQMLIFTCHPERYRSLPDAQFFDLETLRNERGPHVD
ncbi:MAG: hypothetical protein JW888_16445, partial [Pirellulales bacterium]|nr:hypothetical protein [Pirellulales bacterium]